MLKFALFLTKARFTYFDNMLLVLAAYLSGGNYFGFMALLVVFALLSVIAERYVQILARRATKRKMEVFLKALMGLTDHGKRAPTDSPK